MGSWVILWYDSQVTRSDRDPLLIELAGICNNGCRFCSQGPARREPVAEHEPAPAVAVRLEAAGGMGSDVMFVGGEPTLLDELPKWIAQARALNYRHIGLQTNGRRLAYRAYSEGLVAAGLTHLEVSLHGTGAAMHDYHTRVPGSFKQTASGIQVGRRLGLTVTVTTVMTRSNYRHLPEFVDVLKYLGVTSWHLSKVHPSGDAEPIHSQLSPPWEMLRPHMERARVKTEASRITLVTSGLPDCVQMFERAPIGWPAESSKQPCEVCGLAPCTSVEGVSHEPASGNVMLGGMGLARYQEP